MADALRVRTSNVTNKLRIPTARSDPALAA
jgi:hypothetical protein